MKNQLAKLVNPSVDRKSRSALLSRQHKIRLYNCNHTNELAGNRSQCAISFALGHIEAFEGLFRGLPIHVYYMTKYYVYYYVLYDYPQYGAPLN